MKIHETVAENRLRFAQRLNEMSEELATLSKEVDKNRKQVIIIIPILHATLTDDIIHRPKNWQAATKRLSRMLKAAWTKPKPKWISLLKN